MEIWKYYILTEQLSGWLYVRKQLEICYIRKGLCSLNKSKPNANHISLRVLRLTLVSPKKRKFTVILVGKIENILELFCWIYIWPNYARGAKSNNKIRIDLQNETFAAGQKYLITRSLGALWAPTSRWGPFGPLDFVLRALRTLRPCDPCVGDWIVCQPLDSVLAIGQCVSPWIVCQPLDSVLAFGQCVSRWIVCQPLDSVLAVGQCVSLFFRLRRRSRSRNHVSRSQDGLAHLAWQF